MSMTKEKLKRFAAKHYVVILAAVALFIPDIMVRCALKTKIFNEPFNTIIPALFSLCWISLVIYLCRAVMLPGVGRTVYLLFGLAFMTLSFSNYIYYQIFGQYFWLSSVGLVGEAGGYIEYAMGYTNFGLIFATLLDLGLIIFVCVKWGRPVRRRRKRLRRAVIPIAGIAFLHIFMQPAVFGVLEDDWDSWSKPRVVYKQFTDVNKSMEASGLYQFVARDFWKSRFPTRKFDDAEYEKVDKYFALRQKPQKNKYTGIFEGKNVVAVMMESMDDWLINEKYTPTICSMMKDGINFTQYYAPTYGSGYTFNSEFAFNTGFYTPRSAVTATNFSGNSYPYSLPNLFREKDYSVNSFHYNNCEFYNRGIMHKSMGYESYNSFMDYDLKPNEAEADSNALRSDSLYAKMIEKKPFFDLVITYSGHIPYTYDDTKLSIAKARHPELIDPSMDTETNNILLLASDTDDFFKLLLKRLKDDGLLENTVIVAFADHYAYGFSNETLLKKYSHEAGSDILQRVPAFIYTPNLKPAEITKVMQTSDFMPTLINMFGLENSNKYIGNDIFDSRNGGFVYFEDKSWFDGSIHFEPSENASASAADDYVKERSRQAEQLTEINDIVITGNYFGRKK